MDPNETLRIILEKSLFIMRRLDTGDSKSEILDNATELAESVVNLHEWLAKGGFLPTKWTR